MSFLKKFGAFLIGAVCIYWAYLTVYPFSKLKGLIATDFVILLVCVVGIIFAASFIFQKEKKKVIKNGDKLNLSLTPIQPIQPLPIMSAIPQEKPIVNVEPPARNIAREIQEEIQEKQRIRDELDKELLNRLKSVAKGKKRNEAIYHIEDEDVESFFEEMDDTIKKKEPVVDMDNMVEMMDKTVSKFNDELDKTTEVLEHEREKAEVVHNKIQETVKKLYGVHTNLKNTRNRLDKMIKINKMVKDNLDEVGE